MEQSGGQRSGDGSSSIIALCLGGFLRVGTDEFVIAQVACEKKRTVWTSAFRLELPETNGFKNRFPSVRRKKWEGLETKRGGMARGRV